MFELTSTGWLIIALTAVIVAIVWSVLANRKPSTQGESAHSILDTNNGPDCCECCDEPETKEEAVATADDISDTPPDWEGTETIDTRSWADIEKELSKAQLRMVKALGLQPGSASRAGELKEHPLTIKALETKGLITCLSTPKNEDWHDDVWALTTETTLMIQEG
jgi:hypothetical protein